MYKHIYDLSIPKMLSLKERERRNRWKISTTSTECSNLMMITGVLNVATL